MSGKPRQAPAQGAAKADHIIFTISKACSYAGGAAVIVVMLVAVIDVILAKLVKISFPSATEWITYLNILIVFAPLAFVELERGHTRVDLLEGRTHPVVLKSIHIFSLLLSMAVFGFMTYCGIRLVLSQISTGERSSSDAFAKLAFDMWIFGLIYTVGCGLATLSFVWSLVREFLGLSIFGRSSTEEKGGEKP